MTGTAVTTREMNRIRPSVQNRSGGRCEARWDDHCQTRGEHLHHRKLRSQGGENTLDNLCHTCLHCHQQLHANPEVAYQRGLLVHRWDDPATIAVNPAGLIR